MKGLKTARVHLLKIIIACPKLILSFRVSKTEESLETVFVGHWLYATFCCLTMMPSIKIAWVCRNTKTGKESHKV
jgi:hypothetical protein